MDNKNAFSKILILVIIAVLVIGGIFVWQEWLKSDLRLKIKDSRLPKGIEVIEQGDKKIVKNKAEGYEVTVPKEWGAQIMNRGVSGQNLRLEDKKNQKKEASEIATGCISEIFVNQNPDKISLDQWIELHAPGGILSRENITIGNYIPAIKIVGKEIGSYIVIYTMDSKNNNIHEIVLYYTEPDTTGCIENFNRMLATYSFK